MLNNNNNTLTNAMKTIASAKNKKYIICKGKTHVFIIKRITNKYNDFGNKVCKIHTKKEASNVYILQNRKNVLLLNIKANYLFKYTYKVEVVFSYLPTC